MVSSQVALGASASDPLHLSEKEARMCVPKAHEYMRRVGRTLIYER